MGLSIQDYRYEVFEKSDLSHTMTGEDYKHLLSTDGFKFTIISYFSPHYPHLLGILGGGYYLHNISLPIYRNSKNQDNNIRDVFLGYLLVFLSYSTCGVLGYYGFASHMLFP